MILGSVNFFWDFFLCDAKCNGIYKEFLGFEVKYTGIFLVSLAFKHQEKISGMNI